jgi:hypothetical protein
MKNIGIGDSRDLVPKHRALTALRVVLAGMFLPMLAVGMAYALCKAWFEVGVSVVATIFEDDE